jgi:hypothetical protein
MISPRYDPSDECLLAELKAALAETSAVPAGARAVAETTFTWRQVDVELTTLLSCSFDSAVDEAALVRGPVSTPARSMSFENDDLGVEIEIYADRLIGQLLPPQPGVVRLLNRAGVYAQGNADGTGCFVVERPPTGPLRLECTVSGPVLITEWVTF